MTVKESSTSTGKCSRLQGFNTPDEAIETRVPVCTCPSGKQSLLDESPVFSSMSRNVNYDPYYNTPCQHRKGSQTCEKFTANSAFASDSKKSTLPPYDHHAPSNLTLHRSAVSKEHYSARNLSSSIAIVNSLDALQAENSSLTKALEAEKTLAQKQSEELETLRSQLDESNRLLSELQKTDQESREQRQNLMEDLNQQLAENKKSAEVSKKNFRQWRETLRILLKKQHQLTTTNNSLIQMLHDQYPRRADHQNNTLEEKSLSQTTRNTQKMKPNSLDRNMARRDTDSSISTRNYDTKTAPERFVSRIKPVSSDLKKNRSRQLREANLGKEVPFNPTSPSYQTFSIFGEIQQALADPSAYGCTLRKRSNPKKRNQTKQAPLKDAGFALHETQRTTDTTLSMNSLGQNHRSKNSDLDQKSGRQLDRSSLLAYDDSINSYSAHERKEIALRAFRLLRECALSSKNTNCLRQS